MSVKRMHTVDHRWSNQPNQLGRNEVGEMKQTTTPICTTRASNPSTPVTITVTSNPQSSVLFNANNSSFIENSCYQNQVRQDKKCHCQHFVWWRSSTLSYFTTACWCAIQLTRSWQEDITLAPFSANTMTPQNLSVASINVVAKTGELILCQF